MNVQFNQSTPTPIYRHHWLAFWKLLSFISLLLVASVWAFRVHVGLGLLLLALALIGGLAVYLQWHWTIITFTPDHRLVLRRGIFGSITDIFSLFGTITPYQTPLLGSLLDEGSLYLRLAGIDTHIRHIANFGSFYSNILTGAGQARAGYPGLNIIIQFPLDGFDGGSEFTGADPGDWSESDGARLTTEPDE